MVDKPGWPTPRFPPEMEALARSAVESSLQKAVENMAARPRTVSSAACGGDILFLEACRRLGLECYVVLPFAPDAFIKGSVEGPKTGRWVQRFWEQWNGTPPNHREVLSDVSDPDGPYAACNRHIVEIARAYGGPVHLIALWDGAAGDGPGGTSFLVERVQELGGTIDRIDATALLQRVA